jgi:hypothetical protein
MRICSIDIDIVIASVMMIQVWMILHVHAVVQSIDVAHIAHAVHAVHVAHAVHVHIHAVHVHALY